jgi:hypothetical protein
MFPTIAWDSPPTVGWEISPPASPFDDYWQFSGIGTLLD